MRVAAIYFPQAHNPTVASDARAYKAAALAAGDTFDVILCKSTILNDIPHLFNATNPLPEGGLVAVDGVCSHHPRHISRTCRWLDNNYDALFFLTPCPHPTKDYGQAPLWMVLYENCSLPKMIRFTDPYVGAYKWIVPATYRADVVTVSQSAYQKSLEAVGIKNSVVRAMPFCALSKATPLPKTQTRLTIWTSPWTDAHGIKPFMEQVPSITEISEVELYGTGPRYWQIKKKNPDLWARAIGRDEKREVSFDGQATYWGHLGPAHDTIAFQKAWGSVNLQTHGYSMAEVEALYWGAWPVGTFKSELPTECQIPVKGASGLVDAISALADQPMSDSPVGGVAREWVMDTHDAHKLWAQVKEDFSS